MIRIPFINESSQQTEFNIENQNVNIDNQNVNYDELFFNYAETENGSNPPYTKRGGKIPTTVILTHSASTLPYDPFNCHIDYLSFTSRLPDNQNHDEYVQHYIQQLPELIPGLSMSPESKGYVGYTSLIRLTRNGTNIGMVCYGGNNATLYTSLSGQGCIGVDMKKMFEFISRYEVKITRVDMAHDDLDGIIGVRQFKELYDMGDFKSGRGGISPSARFIDDMGTDKGCTLYVGMLKNGKELCVYEKGKQLGDSMSPWVRVEGRLSCEDRVVPYDVLLKPAEYLAGLYPPLRRLSDKHTIIAIIKKHAEITLQVMIENMAISYGKLLNLMRGIGYDDSEIVSAAIRDGIPSRVQVPMNMWAANYVEDDRGFNGRIPAWLQGA